MSISEIWLILKIHKTLKTFQVGSSSKIQEYFSVNVLN